MRKPRSFRDLTPWNKVVRVIEIMVIVAFIALLVDVVLHAEKYFPTLLG